MCGKGWRFVFGFCISGDVLLIVWWLGFVQLVLWCGKKMIVNGFGGEVLVISSYSVL